ncbi:sigma-54-dependent Fis family transcriptional regulator [Algiphilus sp.]|uniref:sigma-54-dependent Fis family transcriptional regulator n=1 Tax=Algiphilus sp. TaxID=1872431 RepID=UPI001CA713E4|nr:sigma-54-dependent Fis family transcriptional regulator [Algiphilus sp.]MBY8964862.1 sigma-54-dependent Fis family transcriptional regulator [Algiphilus acroporae]MCI5062117.1 sigma-54-dependent Fis family transcriptional regulator [Algiphilus sp.]MCI5103659.1 sigma-54-dependent Fis family transcriptional regulator [Algiphilus sp.]
MHDTTYQHSERVIDVVGGKESIEQPESNISSSWSRCINSHGLDPSRRYSPRVEDVNRIAELEDQYDTLIDIARLEMDALYEQIAGSGYALLLTDANGIILCDKVDPNLSKSFHAAGLVHGANWSESMEGTNGIGTCIAEQRAVTVHRTDHFRARHIDLSCTGAPILDPDGALTAVLDASCVNAKYSRANQMHTKAMVSMSSRLIEKCLFLRRFRDQCVLRFHSRAEFVSLLQDGAMAIAEDGTIIGADQVAIALLADESRAELIGRNISEVFDVPPHVSDPLYRQCQSALTPIRDLKHGRRFYMTSQLTNSSTQKGNRLHEAGSGAQAVRVKNTPRTDILDLDTVSGRDPVMQRNARCARRLATSDVAILLQGPTGSGKDVFARAVHHASERANHPFVAVNCAAIPETLIEAELFGYKAGAFTGARKEGARGRILQADGGTLFLDEIGDMPLELQTRLLRVLEERVVTPLGSEVPTPVNIRLISASLRDLKDMVAEGRFREDLYYRLNGITLKLPPLRKRQDLPEIISNILATESAQAGVSVSVSAAAMQLLRAYHWPGNIRELRNVLRTALAMCEDDCIQPEDLGDDLCHPESANDDHSHADTHDDRRHARSTQAPAQPVYGNPLEAAERAALLETIEHHRYNMSRAARTLGMSRNTLYRKMRQHGIDTDALRGGGSR